MTIRAAVRADLVLEPLALFSGVVFLLQACSLTPAGPVATPPASRAHDLLILPSPPGYPGKLTAVQDLHAVRGDESYDLQAVLQLSAEHAVVVLTMPLGPRIATIDWSARGIEVERDLDLPIIDRVSAEDVLAGIVLAFWPEALLRGSLREGVSLVVEPDGRSVLGEGLQVIEIRRGDGDPWNGRTMLVNHLLGYRLSIDSRTVPAA